MALFRGQTAYFRAATRDVAFGTNVRAALAAAGADTNFTVTFTSTTAITQTVNPFTNISNVATDNRTTLGWAFNQNEASTDGVGSTSTRKRYIPAGVWSFQFAWTSNGAALLANYDVVISYHVYRVAASGGTRTLLFSASAVAENVSLTAGSGNGAASSASQPEYKLEPNESIHIAVQINSKATSALLGSTTNTVITCTRSSSGSAFVTLPSPGMRNIEIDTNTATGEGEGSESILVRKDSFSGTGLGSGTLDYLTEFFRAFNAIGKGDADRELLTVMKFAAATGKGVGNRTLAITKDITQAVGEGSGMRYLLVRKDTQSAVGEATGLLDYISEFFRAFLATGEGSGTRSNLVGKDVISATGEAAGTIQRRLELFRTFAGIGEAESMRWSKIFKDVITAIGEDDADLSKAAIFVRDFAAIGEGVPTEEETVIFVREFLATGKATIRPRIALDWDDLPNPEGGGGETIIIAPVFSVFD